MSESDEAGIYRGNYRQLLKSIIFCWQVGLIFWEGEMVKLSRLAYQNASTVESFG